MIIDQQQGTAPAGMIPYPDWAYSPPARPEPLIPIKPIQGASQVTVSITGMGSNPPQGK